MSSPLEGFTNKELGEELARRKEAEDAKIWEALSAKYPCPECGEGPQSVKQDAVEEYRFAPRDVDGRPILFAPYDSEEGTTHGMRYETEIVCKAGHVWFAPSEIKWFDKPLKGAPILPRKT